MRKNNFLRQVAEHIPFLSNWLTPKPPETLDYFFRRQHGKPAAKWNGYLQHYDRHFSPLKQQPIRLLEIGVQAGGSLEVWAEYFQQAQLIIGCDIDPKCASLCYSDPRIKVLIGDVNSDDILGNLDALSQQLDVIIDDGSHHSKDIIRSFVQLFPRLAPGGIYLVEDLHSSYWESYGGGLYDPCSSISFFKKLIDVTNWESWGIDLKLNDFFHVFENMIPGYRHLDWAFLHDVHAIEFCNSMCIIHKRPSPQNKLGSLVLSGQPSADGQSAHHYQATEMTVPDQSQNGFSHELGEKGDGKLDQTLQLRQRIDQLAQDNSKLSTQFYEATKQYYEATVMIQALESELNQLKQSPSDHQPS